MQKALATELTKFVHGQEGLDQAIKVSEALFKGDLNNLKKNEFLMAFNTLNNIFVDQKTSLIDAIVNVGAASSKREAREFLANKAISINGQEVLQENLEVGKIKPIHNDYLIIRRGKKKFFGLKIK
jgi:tyrosyl-tRNA synthetase